MKKIAVITTAFGYGLENCKETYASLFAEEGLKAWYCTREELLSSPNGVEGIIVGVEKADDELFSTCKQTQVAMKFGVGMDNFDKISARDHNIRLANLPGINSDAVAEMTLALMLTVSRRIVELHQSCIEGSFNQICSHSIMGKTLGIVGLGSIGVKVARLAKAFSMRCIGFDLMPYDGDDIEQVSLETLLAESDIITIHIPLTLENYHYFDAKVLCKMKKGAIILNTSRGGIVDEVALARYLQNGHLAGAGIDVFESKKAVSALLSCPQAVCTPHVAAYTHETLRNMEKTIIKKISQLLYQK
ncbi:MAG TPA: hydroxyacid dehydrogenase [Sphaerochaeta sp.]|nr:hydroxyacid dehydrogenase [Sphaerochaeta sp.]